MRAQSLGSHVQNLELSLKSVLYSLWRIAQLYSLMFDLRGIGFKFTRVTLVV